MLKVVSEMNHDQNKTNEKFGPKEEKIKRNEWRKLISILLAVITLYLLNSYNVFEYTGIGLGLLIVVVFGLLISYAVDKIFSLFIN